MRSHLQPSVRLLCHLAGSQQALAPARATAPRLPAQAARTCLRHRGRRAQHAGWMPPQHAARNRGAGMHHAAMPGGARTGRWRSCLGAACALMHTATRAALVRRQDDHSRRVAGRGALQQAGACWPMWASPASVHDAGHRTYEDTWANRCEKRHAANQLNKHACSNHAFKQICCFDDTDH